MINKLKELLERDICLEKYNELNNICQKIQLLIQEDPNIGIDVEKQIINIIQTIPLSDLDLIYLCSILVSLFPKSQYLELLLEAALYSEILSPENKFFIWIQSRNVLFCIPDICNKKISKLNKDLFAVLVDYLKANIKIEKSLKYTREKKRVVVMTQQILSQNHAPTRSTLERSYMLQKHMGMDVLIISTLENSSTHGIIPYYNPIRMNGIDSFNGLNNYPYKDENFKFYQPDYDLNVPDGIQKLYSLIKMFNPYYIIYVGGESYVADIMNDFCPVLTISTVFSSIPETNSLFTMVGRKVSKEEHKFINSEIIEIPFSFEIYNRKRIHTRSEYKIPEDKFILAVVGSRLDADVTRDFIEYMSKINNIFIVFIGNFESWKKRTKESLWLSENSISLGFVDDVVGVLECTDLYVNPKRLGGGFSVIEAFHAGIPAVTINYGDVAVAAGNEFCVNDYDEMIVIIDKYFTNKNWI